MTAKQRQIRRREALATGPAGDQAVTERTEPEPSDAVLPAGVL